MNLLIIGGLLAFALLAILLAIVLGMREQHSEQARANTSRPMPESARQPAQEAPATPRDGRSVVPEKGVSAPLDEQALAILNGQLHELAAELRSLHEQAWNLEQRLRGLSQMVDHIEQTRERRVHVEEESFPVPGESA